MEPLKEYLYVDERRLNAYFEQISATPVAYDKVPTWKAGIGLTTLGAEGVQQLFRRSFTNHEKITQLLAYLRQGSFLGELTIEEIEENWVSRENKDVEKADRRLPERNLQETFRHKISQQFHLLQTQARKVTFPAVKRTTLAMWMYISNPSFDYLREPFDKYGEKTWLITASERGGGLTLRYHRFQYLNRELVLLLPESSAKADAPEVTTISRRISDFYDRGSYPKYSPLTTVLADIFAERLGVSTEVALNIKMIQDLNTGIPLLIRKKLADRGYEYIQDTFFEVLTELGATVSRSYDLQILYRLNVHYGLPRATALLGHPIVITEI